MKAEHLTDLGAAARIAAEPQGTLPCADGAGDRLFRRAARQYLRRVAHSALSDWARFRCGRPARLQATRDAHLTGLALEQLPRRDRACLLALYGRGEPLHVWAASIGVGVDSGQRIFCGALGDVGAQIVALRAAAQALEK